MFPLGTPKTMKNPALLESLFVAVVFALIVAIVVPVFI